MPAESHPSPKTPARPRAPAPTRVESDVAVEPLGVGQDEGRETVGTVGESVVVQPSPRQPGPPPRADQLWSSLATPALTAVIVALVAGLLVGGLTVGFALSRPARYESTAGLIIDQPSEIASAGSDGIVAKLNALRPKYLALVYTTTFTRPVSEQLGIPEGEVAGSLEANAPGANLFVAIGARTKDPILSQRIAQAMSVQLVNFIKEEGVRAFVPPNQRIIMTLAVPAGPGVKVEPTRRHALTLGSVAGAGALIVFYVLTQFVIIQRKS